MSVFAPSVWVFVALTLLAFSCLFGGVNYLYQTSVYHGRDLTLMERKQFNFILLTFCTLQESNPLPWFTKQSAGNVWPPFIFSI